MKQICVQMPVAAVIHSLTIHYAFLGISNKGSKWNVLNKFIIDIVYFILPFSVPIISVLQCRPIQKPTCFVGVDHSAAVDPAAANPDSVYPHGHD